MDGNTCAQKELGKYAEQPLLEINNKKTIAELMAESTEIKQELSLEDYYFENDSQWDAQIDSDDNDFKQSKKVKLFVKEGLMDSDENETTFNKTQEDENLDKKLISNEIISDNQKSNLRTKIRVTDVSHEYLRSSSNSTGSFDHTVHGSLLRTDKDSDKELDKSISDFSDSEDSHCEELSNIGSMSSGSDSDYVPLPTHVRKRKGPVPTVASSRFTFNVPKHNGYVPTKDSKLLLKSSADHCSNDELVLTDWDGISEHQDIICSRKIATSQAVTSFDFCGFPSYDMKPKKLSLDILFNSDDEILADNITNRPVIKPLSSSIRIIKGQGNSFHIKSNLIGSHVIKFKKFENATSSGRARLIDSRGYSYTIERKSLKCTRWRCSVRNKKVYCLATVKQRGKDFQLGHSKHCHPANSGSLLTTKILADIKREALLKPSVSALSIAKQAWGKYFIANYNADISNPQKLANIIFRFRQKSYLINKSSPLEFIKTRIQKKTAFSNTDKNDKNNPHEKYAIKSCNTSATDANKVIESFPHSTSTIDCLEDDSLVQDKNILPNCSSYEVRFKTVDNGTGNGKPRLIDEQGYSYTFAWKSFKGTKWRCSLRNRKVYCHASVWQRGEYFQIGRVAHSHSPDSKALLTAKVTAEIRTKALLQPSVSPMAIVKKSLANYCKSGSCLEIFNLQNLERIITRFRQKTKLRDMNPLILNKKTVKSKFELSIADVIIRDKERFESPIKKSSDSTSDIGNFNEPVAPSACIMLNQECEPLIQNEDLSLTCTSRELTYEKIEHGTGNGRPRLIDNRGYSYTIAFINSKGSNWRCSVRNKKVYCHATVKQNEENFQLGSSEHSHSPNSKVLRTFCALTKVKHEGILKPCVSDMTLAEIAVEKYFESNLCSNIFNPKNLAIIISHYRQKMKHIDLRTFIPNRNENQNNTETNIPPIRQGSFLSSDVNNFKEPVALSACIISNQNYEPLTRNDDLSFNCASYELTYEIIENGTGNGKPSLIDNKGYHYTLKNPSGSSWRCSVRNKKVYCHATVKQNKEKFQLGSSEHSHPPNSKVLRTFNALTKVKQDALLKPSVSDMTMAEIAVEKYFETNLCSKIFKPQNLAIIINRFRQKTKLTGLSTLNPNKNEIQNKADGNILDEANLIYPIQGNFSASDAGNVNEPAAPSVCIMSSKGCESHGQNEDLSLKCTSSDATYERIENGTGNGKPSLIDSRGYSYTIALIKSQYISWRCSVRNKKVYCHATVRQNEENFQLGSSNHSHPPNFKILRTFNALINVKQDALLKPSVSDMTMTEIAMEKYFETNLCSKIFKPQNLTIIINRFRQKTKLTGLSTFNPNKNEIQNKADVNILDEANLIYPIQGNFSASDAGNVNEPAAPSVCIMSSKGCESHGQNEDLPLKCTSSDVTYERIENGTGSGKPSLIDNRGYSYTTALIKSQYISWRCSVRNKKVYCHATVRQNEENFQLGSSNHSHPPNFKILRTFNALTKVKHDALLKPAISDMTMAEIAMEKYFETNLCSKIFKPQNLAMIINRFRQKTILINSSSCSVNMKAIQDKIDVNSQDETPIICVVKNVNISDPNICNFNVPATPSFDSIENQKCLSLIHYEDLSLTKKPGVVIYERIENGTGNGKPRLIDNFGYSYTIALINSSGTSWRCSVRNKKIYCHATVKQNGENFQRGRAAHSHLPNTRLLSSAIEINKIENGAILKESIDTDYC